MSLFYIISHMPTVINNLSLENGLTSCKKCITFRKTMVISSSCTVKLHFSGDY